MIPDIKLKRLCQKGNAAKLIQRFIAAQAAPLSVIDGSGELLLGADSAAQRHPISLGDCAPFGWVCGDNDAAPLLAAFIAYMAQKEIESKLLAQETLSKYKELTLLYELGEKIAACLDIEELARLALDEARRLLPQNSDLHLGILLSCDDPERLSVCAGQGDAFLAGSDFFPLDGITRQVLASGNAEIVNDIALDPRYRDAPGALQGVRALLCAPLKTRDKIFGVLSVAVRSGADFSAAESKVISLLASQVAVALARAHLINERVAQERLQESLKLSRSIQMGMLSTAFPRFSRNSPVDLYAYMEPAREVSGDFYDFFYLNDKILLIVIGDVSDKGVPAALFMVMVKTLIRAIAKQHRTPQQILAALNPELCRDNDAAMFVTLFLALYDLDSRKFTYSFGGHNPPLHLSRDGSVSWLQGESGMALGIFDDAAFSAQTVSLQPGDSVLLYTDGVSEAMDTDNNAFGEERLSTLLDGNPGSDAQQLVETVIAAVTGFVRGAEQSDDITLLALRTRHE